LGKGSLLFFQEIISVAHEYSVKLHDWISEKVKLVNSMIKTAMDKNDTGSVHYYNGQLQELLEIREYLKNKIDLDTQKIF
jgi:hypothetical protein